MRKTQMSAEIMLFVKEISTDILLWELFTACRPYIFSLKELKMHIKLCSATLEIPENIHS